MKISFIHQHDQMDCGPACLKMIANYFGKNISMQYLRENSFITRNGVTLLGIYEAAESIGLEAFPVNISLSELISHKKSLPCILHWNKNHFVVLYKITKNSKKILFHLADPAYGITRLSEEFFLKSWLHNKQGVAVFMNPTEKFHSCNELEKEEKIPLEELFSYLKPYKKKLAIIFFFLLLGSCLTFIFPFLTQTLIDKGVNEKNLSVIRLILIAQVVLFFGTISFTVIRDRLTLIVGTRISITIISEFLKKMFRMPITFFETKSVGDFNQRIIDNERIEKFLTSHSLTTFFSILTFSVFFIVLWYYDFIILFIYVLLSIGSIVWSLFFMKRRKILDYFRFQQKGEHQESIYEIINGVTEMKLNQMEDFKRKKWEEIQERLFATNIRILKLDQMQMSGFEFINQLKNILVTFAAATLVVKDELTIGAMLSISYIIGQMNGPITQLVNFFQSLQDARLSMNRLGEVHRHPEEENKADLDLKVSNDKNKCLPFDKEIILENLSFQYGGPKSQFVLKNINLTIPDGKITAIVGASGSGKTTLLKLLLKFYQPESGNVFYNGDNLKKISARSLRKFCGVVMQDGYIFSDTIERNIAAGDEHVNIEKLNYAAKIANIEKFISESPLGYKKKIGSSGSPISGGQEQRILIARAVYKNPRYIFFDEATSALDAENEKIIHDNLQSFFRGRTVIVIAHRLSTVKNADQIVVLRNGEIAEVGNHSSLVSIRGDYFNLVKNQLELGK